jgi:hypothetical protein
MNVRSVSALGLAFAMTFHSASGQAQTATDVLARCISDSTSGKDRKDLAKWVLVAMSAHPDLKDVSRFTPELMESVSRTSANLFNRLVTTDCRSQARAAMQASGPQAFAGAFRVLGELAMRELMADKDVVASMGIFERFVDSRRIDEVLK